MASFDKDLCKMNELIKKSTIIEERNPARYRLTHDLDQFKPHRNITFGERDSKKPHKTILMVGETGTGKTTLINAIVNYMLGVQREDKVWFEITDDQSNNKSESDLTVHSQTSSITVYGFYLQKSPIDLTIIDTPGYGDTRGADLDKQITLSLLKLSESAEGVHEVHAVCLVIRASQNQLSDRQHYIFDAILSLFGRDIAENIVLLFTHSTGGPPSAMTAVKKAEIKCAVNEQNQPVFFLFDNCQSDAANEEYETIQERSWKLSHSGMRAFFKFLENIKPKTLKMTQEVLQKREQLEANVSNLQLRVQVMEQKQNELKQTQAALEENKKYVEDNKNFEYEVEVSYKEKIPMKPKFWHLTKEAMCCSICEENCHYPGCWWIRDLSRCKVMKDDHCTVCTNKCHSREHVKEAKLYVAKTKTEKRTYEELKKKYDDNIIKVRDGVSVVQKLEEELQEFEEEKKKLLNEAYYSVETLEMIALNTDSLLTLQHIDVLIEKLKEINEPEKAKKLEDIKKRGGEDNTGGLKYVKKINKNK